MGYLLKEALKTLCGVNQWSYAVFWKFGCENPKLLIWEECYYENSGTSISLSDFELNNGQLGIQEENRVHFLVTKMMMDNHINVVGEGLIGRAAFSGSHQWILSHNYTNQEVYSPEVLKEVFQQFSAGMQTIAVIPVLPHGVVQLASKFPILENSVFVEDVKNLILQLGCLPGVLLSENYGSKEIIPNIGIPVGRSMVGNYSGRSMVSKPLLTDQSSCYIGQIPMLSSNTMCPSFPIAQNEAELTHSGNVHHTYTSHQDNSISKAEVIPENLDTWSNQPTSRSYLPRSSFDLQAIVSSSPSRSSFNEPNRLLPASNLGSNTGFASISYQDFGGELDSIPMSCLDSFSVFGSLSNANLLPKTLESGLIADSSHGMNDSVQRDLADVMQALDDDLFKVVSIPHSDNTWKTSASHQNPDPVCKEEERQDLGMQSDDIIIDTRPPRSGDDLFDILGVDFKSKLLNSSWSNSQDSGSESSITNLNKKSSVCAVNRDQSGNVMWEKDHLLDVMISSIQSSDKQILDDNTSCKTTITNTSPKVSNSCGEVGISGRMQAELFGFTKPAVFSSSTSFKSEPCKNGLRSYSQGSSLYGSQISSWIEQGHEIHKPTSSVSTGYSKKTDDTGKTNRKRLKPGENPRPRPKDRQMIQDRVKELREIVPNGAKCSIDALLERTIKHMLFLQSVTKHADKLKHSGESKIFNKEGGLHMKDNSNGGATWAYEVGSQSTVCPIIVEDLNQPRQMLIEMLCEERGLFLEIADIIRGLGLTILKGVMEAQKDKIWARFTVEANRDVTRMEIFVSLVRLLEQNIKNAVPAGNENNTTTDNDAMMVHRFPLPGTSIPVTGRPCSLQ